MKGKLRNPAIVNLMNLGGSGVLSSPTILFTCGDLENANTNAATPSNTFKVDHWKLMVDFKSQLATTTQIIVIGNMTNQKRFLLCLFITYRFTVYSGQADL
ncbi:MAG: hypothetical protein HW384_2176 [Dehalococcoidia bacterium]|nr:hypothetical protein [Dehalococcoidia bacterium]